MSKTIPLRNIKLSGSLLLILLFFSCQKEDITPLTGDWKQTVSVSNGTMISTFHFSDDQRYLLETRIISEDNTHILQSSSLKGRYSVKNSGITFRVDGQKFDWGKEGYVRDETLVVKDALDKNRLVFKKL